MHEPHYHRYYRPYEKAPINPEYLRTQYVINTPIQLGRVLCVLGALLGFSQTATTLFLFNPSNYGPAGILVGILVVFSSTMGVLAGHTHRKKMVNVFFVFSIVNVFFAIIPLVLNFLILIDRPKHGKPCYSEYECNVEIGMALLTILLCNSIMVVSILVVTLSVCKCCHVDDSKNQEDE